MKNLEFQIQKAFFEWVAVSKKQYPALELIYAIPNGGHRNIVTARNLKLTGTKAGIPDVHLPVPKEKPYTEFYAGLWIEFKAGKGKLSPAQTAYIDMLRIYRHQVHVCNDAAKAIEIVKDYLK